MAPAFFHVLDGDVGWHPRRHLADGGGDFFRVVQVGAAQAEDFQQPVNVE